MFKRVSCTLVSVVRVIHALGNLLSKTNQNVVRGFCKLFWAYCFVFCKSLSYFTRDSQESLVVAIYNQIKSRNSQNLVVYYWHFKVKVISFLSLCTARKVYKTVSRLLPSRNFPAQSQLHSVREMIFRMFFSLCCGVFERVND